MAEQWAKIVAEELQLPLTHVFDVLNFYAMFSVKPRGRHVVEICRSAPCYVSKAQKAAALFEKELGIKMGETTPDKLFTLLYTSCVGACDIGPVAKIGDEVYGSLSADKVREIIGHYREVSA